MNRRVSLLAGLVVLLAMLLGAAPAGVAQAQDQRCFPETGFCISGPIRTYWERNGGLKIFGFPITAQAQATVEGRTLQVQWFERDRLEIQADGTVTAGRLGVERLAQLGKPWQPGTKISPDSGCYAWPETGHQVCGDFARYWRDNGGLNRFGYPITPEIQETLGDGKTYTVQYFERRRMERHPENAPPFNLLLGLLGTEVLTFRPTPPNPCDGIPAPINGEMNPNCFRGGTQFQASGFGFRPGERIGFYVTTPDQSVVELQLIEGRAEADRNGTFGIRGSFSPRIPLGLYAITFEGVNSGHKAIVYFKVIP